MWLVTAGTDDAQALKDWKPTSCPESDDNESDYFADDETSSCSSPSHSEVSDSEPEDYSQNSKGISIDYLILILLWVVEIVSTFA